MIELILIRHGETDSNKKGTYLGWTDIELNSSGIKQAYLLKQKLAGNSVTAIYSSPLARARRTAEIVNENFNLEIAFSDDLKERNFGAWDDLTYEEITQKYPIEHEHWLNDPANYCISGGESSVHAYERIVNFIKGLIDNNEEGVFVIVTHLGCVRKMIAYLLGMTIQDSWRFRVDNCTITRLTLNDEKYAYLTQLNCI